MRWALVACSLALGCGHSSPAPAPRAPEDPTQIMLEALAIADPEEATEVGYEAADVRACDLGPHSDERAAAAYSHAAQALRDRARHEADPEALIDLEILAHAAELRARQRTLDRTVYAAVAPVVFRGVESLVRASHVGAIVRRLRAYAGMDGGEPLTSLAEARARARFADAQAIAPLRAEVLHDLDGSITVLDSIERMCEQAGVDAGAPLAALRAQLTAYDAFVRSEVLAHAVERRTPPPERYARMLEERGIDVDPRQLAAQARTEFAATQAELNRRTREVPATVIVTQDYRDVLRALGADQIPPAAILDVYGERLRALDAILAREHIISVPSARLPIRLATEAEDAMMPAPHYDLPSLIGRGGGTGEFVLPRSSVSGPGPRLTDFASPAASWWLTAHEAHPGHALQFTVIASTPLSLARRYFGMDSASTEGWGLYAEGLVRPYLPWDGQIAVLQARLLRAAHAFLDVEVNLGLLTPEEARRVLLDDVVTSEAWADVCIQRYTFLMPAQAPSYYYGATRLEALRHELEQALGPRFDLQAFNDFVLRQGLLPANLLRQAALRRFRSDRPT